MLSKIRFLARCIVEMDYKSLFRTVSSVHSICGKSRVYLFFDVVYCGLKYGAGHKDYLLCEFYNLSAKQRATYVTRGINNSIVAKLNSREYYHLFDNKNEFYSAFSDYIKRDWMYLPQSTRDDFIQFVALHNTVIIKPKDACCGRGVEKLALNNFVSAEDMYAYVVASGREIVEEVVIQHPKMQRINPDSVNTIRVGTVLHDGVSRVVYAFTRIGNSDAPVDNINAGGMCAPIDLNTGVISKVAYDKNRKTYLVHPKSACEILGFKIPHWEETKIMCVEAAQRVPQMGYIGWDVAIAQDGPLLIEGNSLPGHDILQMPPHLPEDKTGMLPIFRRIVTNLG